MKVRVTVWSYLLCVMYYPTGEQDCETLAAGSVYKMRKDIAESHQLKHHAG